MNWWFHELSKFRKPAQRVLSTIIAIIILVAKIQISYLRVTLNMMNTGFSVKFKQTQLLGYCHKRIVLK